MSAAAVGGSRVAALDGLRGCAILLVIAAHAASPQVQSLGAAGVTVFFVLSGYLITTILLSGRSDPEPGRLRSFYLRRARRLLPALAVLLVFEVSMRIASGQSLVPVVLAGAYGTNFAAASGQSSTLDHTWSLALEEQFYLLWPLVVLAVWRRKRAVTLVLTVAAGSALARAILYMEGKTNVAWFSPATRADAILVGCALAIALARGCALPHGARRHAMTGAALVALVAPFVWTSRAASLVLIPAVSVATAVLITQLVMAQRGPLPVVLSVPPLRWTGRLSYAMYLWHPFALAVVLWLRLEQRFLATCAISAAIASVSWVVVERHFLRGKDVRSAAAADGTVDTHRKTPTGPLQERDGIGAPQGQRA